MQLRVFNVFLLLLQNPEEKDICICLHQIIIYCKSRGLDRHRRVLMSELLVCSDKQYTAICSCEFAKYPAENKFNVLKMSTNFLIVLFLAGIKM